MIAYINLNCPGYSQENTYLHPDILGVHVFQNDLVLGSFQQGNVGLGINYLKGLRSRLDFSSKLSGSFPDSISKNSSESDKALLLNLDAGVRIRILAKPSALHPFLLGGLGAYSYRQNAGCYAFAGTGLQYNTRDIYITLSLQYRFSFAGNLLNHYYYSLAISGLVGKPRKRQADRNSSSLAITIIKDRDGDGIPDPYDLCPDKPGLAVFQGCPDADNDGIEDAKDNCPLIPGVLRYAGCPIPDRDKDGINDEDDNCIDIPGLARYNGCPVPDSDGDGLNDELDSCVMVAGLLENRGCPLLEKKLKEQVDLAARNIVFHSGSAELLPSSFAFLDSVIHILDDQPTIKLHIEGHTDSDGDAESNRVLSEKRAKTVMSYLASQGIESSRLSSQGFGEEKPIASNETSKGKATNRRVELRIFY